MQAISRWIRAVPAAAFLWIPPAVAEPPTDGPIPRISSESFGGLFLPPYADDDTWLPTAPPATAEGAETPRRAGTAHAKKAREHAARGEWEQAGVEVSKALTYEPGNGGLLMLAGQIAIARHQFLIAEDYLAQLAEQFPDQPGVGATWGGVLLRVGRFDKADGVLSNVLASAADDPVARFHMGCTRIAQGRVRETAAYLRTRSSEETGRFATWAYKERDVLRNLLGEDGYTTLCSYILAGGHPSDLRTTGSAVDENEPDGVAGLMSRAAEGLWAASASMRAEEWAAAANRLQDVIDLGVSAPAVAHDLAVCWFRGGESKKAFAAFKELAARYPDEVQLLKTSILRSDPRDRNRPGSSGGP